VIEVRSCIERFCGFEDGQELVSRWREKRTDEEGRLAVKRRRFRKRRRALPLPLLDVPVLDDSKLIKENRF
jgi:hypothetical protein